MHYYIEYGGGLGDVFYQMYRDGSCHLLSDLGPVDHATVVLISHNPHVRAVEGHLLSEARRQRRLRNRKEMLAKHLERQRRLRVESEAAKKQVAALRAGTRELRREQHQASEAEREQRQIRQEALRTEHVEGERRHRAKSETAKQQTATRRAKLARRRSAVAAPPRRGAPPAAPAPWASSESAPSTRLPENLSWLSTQNSLIVDENGKAVSLRGVTVVGLDTAALTAGQTLAEALGLDEENLSVITDLWSLNLVRLSFRAQAVLSGNDSFSSTDWLVGVDDLIASAAEAGLYVLLALEARLDHGAALLPGADTFQCWRLLADRYQHEPAVLYELFYSSSPRAADWLQIALLLVGAIRKEHPASLLFVGNGSAAVDVSGLPLLFSTGDPVHNIVYTIRIAGQQSWFDQALALPRFAQLYPVFASEWSRVGADLDRLSESALSLFERCGIGWAACNWNAEPKLVADAVGHDFTPSRWGFSVQRAASLPVRPQLPRWSQTSGSLLDP